MALVGLQVASGKHGSQQAYSKYSCCELSETLRFTEYSTVVTTYGPVKLQVIFRFIWQLGSNQTSTHSYTSYITSATLSYISGKQLRAPGDILSAIKII